MSTYRLCLISIFTAHLIFVTLFCMLVVSEVYLYNPQVYSPVPYLTIHTLHFLVILVLRWLYETPLETVQEAARLAGGPWAKRMALKPGGSKRRLQPLCKIEYNARDYCFYTKAGTIICVALGHWTFWLWLIIPEYQCVTIHLGLAGAIIVWRRRMDFLGPGYQFAWDVEAENAAAGYCGETFSQGLMMQV
ncbi:hypothetical protein BDZ89DRAFT_1075411 [Hymenopellis radicata]|nr:hypothetical protein BDZ89DRAFT_1075411 [Hymenopellis radicata]